LEAIFYRHIIRSNLLQTTKFHSVIPNFDKVMPYKAWPPKEFLRILKDFTTCSYENAYRIILLKVTFSDLYSSVDGSVEIIIVGYWYRSWAFVDLTSWWSGWSKAVRKCTATGWSAVIVEWLQSCQTIIIYASLFTMKGSKQIQNKRKKT